MSNSYQICFLPQADDSHSFANSVAINDKYLVVGDPGANRIVVYQKNSQNQWYRNREIYPPENSTSYKRSNGFGISLLLGENYLIVNNWSTERVTTNTNHNRPGSIFWGQYFVQLDREQNVVPIELSTDEKDGFVEFYVLSEDRPKLITLPDNNDDSFSYQIKCLGNFAVSENLLLVGLPSHNVNSHNNGKAWLFDLHALNSEAMELAKKKAFLGGTVAISKQFAVVGNKKTRRLMKDNTSFPKTLIKSLKNGSTVVIDDWGRLSLDKNILTVMLPSSRSHMRAKSVLKIFTLDEDATPHLVQERQYNRRAEQYLTGAWIQNGWLITVFRFGRMGHIKFCLELLELIINK